MPQYELNLRDYLRIFRKRKFIIISTFLAVTFLSAIFVPRQSISYKATATIKIEERKTIAGLLTERSRSFRKTSIPSAWVRPT